MIEATNPINEKITLNNNNKPTLTREQKEAVYARYAQYCQCLTSLATQCTHIEDMHGMNLSDTQDVMWMFLEELVANKPDWLR